MMFCRRSLFGSPMLLLTVIALVACRVDAGTVETIAGTGKLGFSGDGGPATKALLNNVYAVARGPDGLIYFCDMDNHRVRRILSDGTVETYVGSGQRGHGGDGGPADQAALDQPYEMAWDREGNLFVVELGNHDIRRIDFKTGLITTIAGNGKPGFSGDGGPAIEAQLNQPHSIAIDPSGDLYICDIRNHRIRKIDMQTGIIRTWSGTGDAQTSPDGTSIGKAALHGPRSLAFGADGKCYLALREGNVLLRLDPKTDQIQRVAGTGRQGFSGHGGPALAATLSGPKCVSIADNGNVYIADTESHSIRYLDVATGTMQLLVGDGKVGDGPDGHSPLNCRLARPHGVFVDRDGSILIGDSENHRVRVYRDDASSNAKVRSLTLDFSTVHQTMDNFGASDAWSIDPMIKKWAGDHDEAIERLADWLFSIDKGIGLSAWRFNIGAGSTEQGSDSKVSQPLRRAELLVPVPGGAIDRTKQRGQIRMLQEAYQRGVKDFVAFVNSPPVWATRNGLSHPAEDAGKYSSNLDPQHRTAYSQFLVQVLQYLRSPEVGVPVNYISPVNEPTWEWEGQTQEGTPYSMDDLKALYREVHRALSEAGLSEQVHVDGPEAVEYTATLSDVFKQSFDEKIYSGGMNRHDLGLYRNYIDQLLGDQEMRGILHNRLSFHGYFSDAWEDRMGELRDLVWENIREISPDAKVWMSEFCILGDAGNARDFVGQGFDINDMDYALHVAKVIHRDLVRMNASAWHWWLAVTPHDYKDGLLKVDPGFDPQSIRPSKVMWVLGNYSRFIRPGYQRLELSGGDDLDGIMASAFRSPDGDAVVMVIINASDEIRPLAIETVGLSEESSLKWEGAAITNANNDLQTDGDFAVDHIPARSVLTITARIEATR